MRQTFFPTSISFYHAARLHATAHTEPFFSLRNDCITSPMEHRFFESRIESSEEGSRNRALSVREFSSRLRPSFRSVGRARAKWNLTARSAPFCYQSPRGLAFSGRLCDSGDRPGRPNDTHVGGRATRGRSRNLRRTKRSVKLA